MAQIIFRYESSQRRALEICKSTLAGGYARRAIDAALAPVSYTHLTLPTNREV